MASRWSEREDDKLVDLIYDTAFDEQLWPWVLREIADRAGAHPANLLQIDVMDGHGFGLTARTPEDTASCYFAEWAQRNPIGLVQDAGDYHVGWTPRITRDSECVDRLLLERSDYWNEFLVPIGAFHSITLRLALRDNDVTAIGVGRPAHLGQFEDEDVDRVRPFHRHLIRAERIGRSLGLRQAAFDRFDTLLTSSPDALFFLDDRFGLTHWTGAADALLRRDGALRAIGGHLRAADGGADALLQRALATALAGGAPPPMTVRGARTGEELSVSVARLGERALAGVTGARCLLVSVRPVAAPDASFALRTSYGLTAAEAELALALQAGTALRDVAAKRGVSINTVRSQLSALFDKTGCRRQQDLVRLLMRHSDQHRGRQRGADG